MERSVPSIAAPFVSPQKELYARMIASGSKPAITHQVHRTIRTALNEAQRRRHLMTINPATVAKAPTLGDDDRTRRGPPGIST